MTSYENAGVNLDAADELVDRIGWRVTSTWTGTIKTHWHVAWWK